MRRVAALLLGLLLLLAGVAAAAENPPPAESKRRIWPDESIYFIFLDRFHNGDPSNDRGGNQSDPRGWHGGDLQGVINKLDYIKAMGFTAIWITPHVQNNAQDYHGYGAVDFFAVDPHFGTVEKAAELVEMAHAKGLKVLFDIAVNHTGPANPLVWEKPDWFHPNRSIKNWNDQQEVQEGWIFDLPDFDQSRPEVRDYILQYSKFWIEKTGVDGFRLDTVKHVPADFFKWYVLELQKVKPDFWVIGEVWESAPIRLSIYQDAGVTALIDFPVSEAARRTFAKDAPMTQLASAVRQVGITMEDPWQLGVFLDNHDIRRFVSEAADDQKQRLKLGLIFLMTQRSIPIVYYGTEIAMPGGNDPFNRDDFPWGQETNPDVRELMTKLNGIRRDHVALRRGTLEALHTDAWRYVYARQAGNQTAVVALNNHASEGFVSEVDVAPVGLAEGTRLRDALTGHQVQVVQGKIAVQVGARTGAIYVVETGAGKLMLWVGGATAVILALGAGALIIRRRKAA